MANLGLLYAFRELFSMPLGLTRFATDFLLEVNISGFKLAAVYNPVESREADRKHVVLNNVVRRLTPLNERGDNLVDLDEFTERKIKPCTTLREKLAVFLVSLACVVHLFNQVALNDASVELRAGVTYMRCFGESLAFNDREFGAPLVTRCLASVTAKSVTVASATGMMNLAGVELRAAVGIILKNGAVTLNLTLNG